MKIHNKCINGFSIQAWNDSGATWAIRSIDKDGWIRIQHYDQTRFTLKSAIDLHCQLYSKM